MGMWGWTVMGALVAGADAQIICICQIFAMFALISYFFKVDHKLCVLGGLIFIVLFSYVGVVPMPTWPSVTWQPAAIWLVIHQVMLGLLGVMFLTGNTEKHYESYPSTKEFMFKGGSLVHEREILLGATLIGTVLAETASFANASTNFCLIFAPSGIVLGGVHWIGLGDKKNAMNVFVLSSIMFCFGLFQATMVSAPSGIVVGAVHWIGSGDEKTAIIVLIVSSITFCFGLFFPACLNKHREGMGL